VIVDLQLALLTLLCLKCCDVFQLLNSKTGISLNLERCLLNQCYISDVIIPSAIISKRSAAALSEGQNVEEMYSYFLSKVISEVDAYI